MLLKFLSRQILKHTNASRRVSDSSNSNIRRASWILFEISSICFRLEMDENLLNKLKSFWYCFKNNQLGSLSLPW